MTCRLFGPGTPDQPNLTEVLEDDVRDTLSNLDGTEATAIQLLTGVDQATLADLGGLPAEEESCCPVSGTSSRT